LVVPKRRRRKETLAKFLIWARGDLPKNSGKVFWDRKGSFFHLGPGVFSKFSVFFWGEKLGQRKGFRGFH